MADTTKVDPEVLELWAQNMVQDFWDLNDEETERRVLELNRILGSPMETVIGKPEDLDDPQRLATTMVDGRELHDDLAGLKFEMSVDQEGDSWDVTPVVHGRGLVDLDYNRDPELQQEVQAMLSGIWELSDDDIRKLLPQLRQTYDFFKIEVEGNDFWVEDPEAHS